MLTAAATSESHIFSSFTTTQQIQVITSIIRLGETYELQIDREMEYRTRIMYALLKSFNESITRMALCSANKYLFSFPRTHRKWFSH